MKILWVAVASLILASGTTLASAADETATFDVDKMTCATCPIAVRAAMLRVDGVKKVDVSLENNLAVVTFDPKLTTAADIGQASTDVGFPATLKETE